MKQGFFDRYMKYLLLAVSLGFLGCGIWRDEAALVLKKAAAICMECIGIG